MNTLVLIEHDNQQASAANAAVLSAAKHFGSAPVAVVIGYQCKSVAESVAQYEGVESVLLIDSESFEHPLAELVSKVMHSLPLSSFQHILAPATTFGKNVLPRLAALLDAVQISDVTRIIDHQTFEHPIYAGNAIETVQVLDDIKLLTIRTTAFEPLVQGTSSCSIKTMDSSVSWDKTSFIKIEKNVSKRPDLSNATRIVSGGRGLQDAEKFKLIETLADALGAAVGASRAAVDAGFVPNDYQVGQTGKIVAPALYIAVGISGAIQHLAGMKDSKVIVAINKDADAPIFQIADYGLVGDLFELVPQLVEQLEKRG